MIEVYVDYVICSSNGRKSKAQLKLSTSAGNSLSIKVSEDNTDYAGLMTKCLAKYASGLYSKSKRKLVPQCDVTEDMEGFEPYHLNYRPECVEREFEQFEDTVSGYRFGSLNPLYGGKVKAIIMDIMHYIDDNDMFQADIAFYDDNDIYLGIYSAGCNRDADRGAFVLETLKQITAHYYYSVDEGFWGMYGEGETPAGTFYGIDFDIDDDVIDYDYTIEGEQ